MKVLIQLDMLTHYEELASMLTRLDRVLPGNNRPSSRLAVLQGWSWRNTVIEAKPVSLALLSEEEDGTCRFRGEIPSQYHTTLSRRWYIREQTRRPCLGQAIEGINGFQLPSGVSLWHAPEDARRLLVLARYDAKLLWDGRDVWRASMPCNDDWQAHGTFSMFETTGPPELCFRDSVRLLRPLAPYLARLSEEYAKSLCWMYGLEADEFEENCILRLTWIAPSIGKRMELAPASASRFENGPIVHVGVGLPVVPHDLAPVLPGDEGVEWPVQVSVPEGVMVCVDGASRIRYSHGHPPVTACNPETWFSLTFYLACNRRSAPVAFERETKTVIMQTPVLKDRVVTSHKQALPHAVEHPDAMGKLLTTLRRRLRATESHLLAERCAGRYARDQLVFSSGDKEQPSSRSVLE
jgi:hypothetical protein